MENIGILDVEAATSLFEFDPLLHYCSRKTTYSIWQEGFKLGELEYSDTSALLKAKS